ncbi:copper amine oxidase N-terminal domain-containing protein [Paenibacillus rhizovicinus]|uniref:Copper amine oxidase N-terminal domain-containing protein n=1 Tax=Paenibacillus rhizovicinus TaxID=2704463 RepID=A0A6C0NW14_9BACL|nr:stalk domain-containing protein [Paenibacillus rhizovicinus]QHW30311.1 copper amine oxidase N-terminal domain-containing protein [Paenibacillus rhizovicinus]
MKSLKWMLLVSLFVMSITSAATKNTFAEGGIVPVTTTDTTVTNGLGFPSAVTLTNRLDLTMGSANMLHNGTAYKSAQPVVSINGRTFIPFSSIAARYGYKISYDAAKKESIAKSDQHELVFKMGSGFAYRDGVLTKLTGVPFISNGYLMVPLRSWGEMADSTIAVVNKTITLKWSTTVIPPKPTANFEVQPGEIFAGQTIVSYIDHSTNATGEPFVDERWEGRMDVFPEPGTYVITHQLEDTNGIWSEPYSVTVTVKAPNMPPVADFTTEKSQYRIGEEVNYIDMSTDDENAIVRRTYTGNDKVFFEAGDHSVTLVVEDSHGLTSTVTKTVSVSNSVLYTKEEYERLNTKVGDNFTIDGASVPKMPAIGYTINSVRSQLVRSNSPETLIQEGIAYEAQLTGQVRFMFHNVNKIGYPVRMYLLATNNNSSTVNVNTSSIGIGGPDPIVANTAKMSTLRYLTSVGSNPSPKWMTVKPHQTIEILPDISKVPMKLNEVLSAYADIYSDQELQFHVVVVAADKNPITELPKLAVMPRDGIHVRGTFNNADRTIDINDTLGDMDQRIVIGDKTIDKYLDGIDDTTGELQYNTGNFGTLYRMHLPHVSPNTLIALNPRGGIYTGSFMVNGRVVTSSLMNNTQATVLYRTGDTEESVDLVFTLAGGSNLPIALTFLPLPELRW